jgi:hypothetical protein
VLLVAFAVPKQLSLPIIHSRAWNSALTAIRVKMPKTAMNEDYSFPLVKHKIWNTWQLSHMQTISKAQSMQETANQEFWFGILALDAAHVFASPLTTNSIHL